jgi:hypothetical protein
MLGLAMARMLRMGLDLLRVEMVKVKEHGRVSKDRV